MAAIRYHRLGRIGVLLVVVISGAAILAPILAPHDPLYQYAGQELIGPSRDFLLGTDRYGRDVLSRLLYGGRPTLLVGLVAVPSGAAIGTVIGVIAGYSSDLIESISMRTIDLVLAFPAMILGILVVAVRGPGVQNVAIAIAIYNVPVFARLSRASVAELRSREFIAAAVSIGSPKLRIMAQDLLPNIIPPLLVQVGVAMAIAGLLEAGLSFLGLGTQVPRPSWGNMLSDARDVLRRAPLLGVYPGLLLAGLLVGLNFVVDALRDVLDPRSRTGEP